MLKMVQCGHYAYRIHYTMLYFSVSLKIFSTKSRKKKTLMAQFLLKAKSSIYSIF